MATLSLKGINKIYDNSVQAVFDFNLDIKDKEFIVFVGPSGCGKSTTLRMVAGLEEITSGQLYIDGRMVNSVAPKDRDIAMVFQNYALYPHMTVYENMAFALKLRKLPLPIYTEDNPEIVALKEEQKGVWKQIDALNRKFKKKQNDLSILPERAQLYEKVYALQGKIDSLRTPINGKEEYRIALLKKSVEELNKEIEKYQKFLNGKFGQDENNVKILTNGIEERKAQIEKINGEIEYYENNDVPLTKLRHLTRREIEIEINKTADQIDLIRYLYRKPSALSGGQRQRVALGRAIVRKPKVFLMDEPLSNLDAKLRVQTRTSITKIHERVGATTIYVTHDQTEAMTMADRIVIMKDGYIQQIGTPEEVYNDPANKFVGGFIGSPSMNFIVAEVNGGKAIVLKQDEDEAGQKVYAEGTAKDDPVLDLPKDAAKLLKPYEGKKVIIGIRPEDVYVDGDKNNENPGKKNNVVVSISELLGSESIVYSDLNGQRIILETSAKRKIKENDKISICFDNSKLYLFDFESENRIK